MRIPCLWKEVGDLRPILEPERPDKSNSFAPRILYLAGYHKRQTCATRAYATSAATAYEEVMGLSYNSDESYSLSGGLTFQQRAFFSNIEIPILLMNYYGLILAAGSGRRIAKKIWRECPFNKR